MPAAALIPAAIQGVSSLIQGKKAKKAADIQSQAATAQAAQTKQTGTGVVQRFEDMYNKGVEQYKPYTDIGTKAVTSLSDFLNLGEGGPKAEAFKFDPASAAVDPSLDFRIKEGMKAIERSAASKGNIFAGGTGKALTQYAQDLASTEYQNMFNRALTEWESGQRAQDQIYRQLFGVSGLGANAAGATAGLGQWFGNQAGATEMSVQEMINNLLMGGAGSQASAQIAQGNAWGNALNAGSNAVSGMIANKRLGDLLGQQTASGAASPTYTPSTTGMPAGQMGPPTPWWVEQG